MELSDLIESIDILDYISQYTEFTEKNGEYWALSPFKDEDTPSFSVRKETNSFYDFSSGIGGNVLTFVRYYDKCGYAEAEKVQWFRRDNDIPQEAVGGRGRKTLLSAQKEAKTGEKHCFER